MEIKEITEAVAKALIPEISKLGSRMDRMEGRMEEMSSRLTDINDRILGLEQQMNGRILGLEQQMNGKMLGLEEQMIYINQRLDDTNNRIDKVREELSQQIGETNKRIDRLYEVIVRREEHKSLDRRVLGLEKKVREIEEKIAA